MTTEGDHDGYEKIDVDGEATTIIAIVPLWYMMAMTLVLVRHMMMTLLMMRMMF